MGQCLECGREAGIFNRLCPDCKYENTHKLDELTEQPVSVDQSPERQRPQTKSSVQSIEQPISITQPQQTQSSSFPVSKPKAASTSARILALTGRYQDAYLVAKITVGLGSTIKVVGIVLAILIFLGTFMFASFATQQSGIGSRDGSGGVFVVAMLGGGFYAFIVGFVFYFIGVIVSAQGQVLRATLDNTVGNSPFLENEQKAAIMSLPA
jgi:hypothetical protein